MNVPSFATIGCFIDVYQFKIVLGYGYGDSHITTIRIPPPPPPPPLPFPEFTAKLNVPIISRCSVSPVDSAFALGYINTKTFDDFDHEECLTL